MVTISHSIRPINPINKAFIKSAIYSVVLKSSTYARLGGAGAPYRVGGIYILVEYFDQLSGIN